MITKVYCVQCGEELAVVDESFEMYYEDLEGATIKVGSHECKNSRLAKLENALREIKEHAGIDRGDLWVRRTASLALGEE